MKKKELEKVKGKSLAALEKDVVALKDKLHKAMEAIHNGKEKNAHLVRAIRQDIAQTKTIISHKRKEEIIAKKEEK